MFNKKKFFAVLRLAPIVAMLSFLFVVPAVQATPLTCNMSTITGDDDGSFAMSLPFSLQLGTTEYNQVYYSTNGLMSFGQPDGNFWSYPSTPSVTLAGRDWVSWGPGAYTSYGYNESSFCIEWSVRPFPMSSGDLTQIRLVVNRFPNGGWHGEITTLGWIPDNIRRGIVWEQNGTPLPIAAAFDVNGGVPVEVPPAPAPTSLTEPPAIPTQCWDGSTVYAPATCPSEPSFTCWDGTNTHYASECSVEPVVICWDNSQVHYQSECSPLPPDITCWNGEVVPWNGVCQQVPPLIDCWNGTSVNWDAQCPVQPPSIEDCAANIGDPSITADTIASIIGTTKEQLQAWVYSGDWTIVLATGSGEFGNNNGNAPDIFCGNSLDNTVSYLDSNAWTRDYFFGGAGDDSVIQLWHSNFYGGDGNDTIGRVDENGYFYGGAGNNSCSSVTGDSLCDLGITIDPTPTETPTPTPSETPTVEPTPTPTEQSPTPQPTVEPTPEPLPSETPIPSPSPSVSESQHPTPVATPSPSPSKPFSSPSTEVLVPVENPTPDPSPSSIDLPSNNLTTEEAVNQILSEYNTEEAVPFSVLQDAGLDYSDLPPDQPVMLDNGVVLTAEVADALQLFENPSEILSTVLTDPGKALKALASVGADMTPAQRHQSTQAIVAAVIAGQLMNALSAANMIGRKL